MVSCIRKGGVPLPSFPFSAAEWAERHLCGMRGVGRGDWELSDAVEQQLTSAPRGVPRTGLISSFVQLFRASEVTPDLSPGSRQHRCWDSPAQSPRACGREKSGVCVRDLQMEPTG